MNLLKYRKFSNKGTPFDPKPAGFHDVFEHISAKYGPFFILRKAIGR